MGSASRWQRVKGALTPPEWRRAAGLGAVIAGLHVVGFFLLFAVVVPHDYALGSGVFTVSVGITAYTLGMRHAFDADHIGAIDSTTRKLMGEGQRPLSVGFFFSLGHSTIVFAMALLFAVGVRGLADDSTLHDVTGVVGPVVSGSFLFVIGVLNLAVLAGIVRGLRRGSPPGVVGGGLLARLYSRATRAVTRPWQMYPLGILFGLGFDTATEVALLLIAAGAAGA